MKTILIVDDEKEYRAPFRKQIEKEYPGVKVDEATNGVEALWYVRKKYNEGDVPTIVIMDVRMPRIDGVEAAKRMRARGYDVPIYLRTSNPYVVSASKIGIEAVIDKFARFEEICRTYFDKYLNS